MRLTAGLMTLLAVLTQVAPVLAQQAANGLGVSPTNLRFVPVVRPNHGMHRPGALSPLSNMGFNPLNFLTRSGFNFRWPPTLGFSNYPDGIAPIHNPFPTTTLPFDPLPPWKLTSADLPTMRVTTSSNR
jgi:hypothetical protein